MFARLHDEPAAHATFEEARAVLGYDLRDDEAALQSTVGVQLSLLAAGVASARVLQACGVRASAVAGHSVGAFAAAVAAEAIAFADALRIVHERAQTMERLFPQGYGMGAVIGLRESILRGIVERVDGTKGRIFVANMNSPLQYVLAGEITALNIALDEARRAGAHRGERLSVAVPSHCPLLAPVKARLEQVLANVEIREPQMTYVGSVGPRVIRDARGLRDDLAAGVAHEVRWYDATTMLVELGTALFIEAIPGRILSDLIRSAFPDARAIALDDIDTKSVLSLARRA
jgi:malonate decarboxylase epsilon subunit